MDGRGSRGREGRAALLRCHAPVTEPWCGRMPGRALLLLLSLVPSPTMGSGPVEGRETSGLTVTEYISSVINITWVDTERQVSPQRSSATAPLARWCTARPATRVATAPPGPPR